MKNIFYLIFIIGILSCCIGSNQSKVKYICYDGSVVSNKSDCPKIIQNNLYICPDGKRVERLGDCNPRNHSRVKIKTTVVTKYICPNGAVVEDYSYCNITIITTIKTTTTSSTTTETEKPVRISELNLYKEWVEIKNNGDSSVDMGGWILRDRENRVYEFPVGFKLYPKKSVRVHTGEGIDNVTDLYWHRRDNIWNNDGDTAMLLDSMLNVIDTLSIETKITTTLTSTTTTTTLTPTTTLTSTTTTTTLTPTTTLTSTTTTTTIMTGSVIINEIMYNPKRCDDDYCEWIELYNPSPVDIDLSGWTLCDKKILPGYVKHTDSKIYNNRGYILKSGKYAVITDGGTGTEVYEKFDVDTNSLALHVNASTLCKDSLSNEVGKPIDLKDSHGSIIDFIIYKIDLANGNGKTLIRVGDYSEYNLSEGTVDGGTPGYENL
ncbi:MAG: hypothetical protein DRO92_04655 [Candidatus Altiarchaeales archaeon]|nr:MAG: hypothetical protein DRO92_04655 [Candidatus Altiarchaeales archaeon]